MIVIPAIDLLDEKVVRLKQGKYDAVTTYELDPVLVAKDYKKKGAELIHIVDLNGAKDGQPKNLSIIKKILSEVDVKIELGGGIRDIDTLQAVFNIGIHRAILGTSAIKNPEFVKKAIDKFGEKIVIGIDAKDGYIAIEGWEELSKLKAKDFARKVENLGAKTIIYTDINTDGMLNGPNIEAMKEMVDSVNIDIIASGGVSKADDILALKKIGVTGVITGKAIYEGKLDLQNAIELVKNNTKNETKFVSNNGSQF